MFSKNINNIILNLYSLKINIQAASMLKNLEKNDIIISYIVSLG